MSKAAADRLATWRPLSLLQDLVQSVGETRLIADENRTTLNRLESLMADTSALLNEVADGLRGPLATSITELIAENQRLAADNASLSGEDVAESAAAQNVRGAFDQVAGLFAAPEVPDVDPLPPVDAEPTPGDGGVTTDEAPTGDEDGTSPAV